MSSYVLMPDGSVKADQYGREVAFFDPDGTVRATRYGQVLGHVDDDGTVRKDSRYGQVLGVVASDGTVKNGPNGQVVGRVEPPVHKRGALLLLLG